MTIYTDYKVVESYSRLTLETSVNMCISKGYQPIGGVSVFASGQNSSNTPYVFYQAVAKPKSCEFSLAGSGPG